MPHHESCAFVTNRGTPLRGEHARAKPARSYACARATVAVQAPRRFGRAAQVSIWTTGNCGMWSAPGSAGSGASDGAASPSRGTSRTRPSRGERRRMAKRRKKRPLRPRVPSRVKKRTRKGGVRSAQHHELIGLGLLALGIFLASVLYLGWSGGMVGGAIADGFKGAIGAAAYVAPVAFVAVGALMVARSTLVDVRPFRTGLIVTAFGLLAALGASQGGAIGRGLEKLFGLLVGSTGTLIIGVLALVIGTLLLSGASAGALVRRSGHAVKRAHSRARRALPAELPARPAPVIPIRATSEPPVDAVHDYPDIIGENQPAPLLVEPRSTEGPDQPSLFDVGGVESHEEYEVPGRNILRRAPAANELSSDVAERPAAALAQTPAHFGVEATIVGQISGPRVT